MSATYTSTWWFETTSDHHGFAHEMMPLMSIAGPLLKRAETPGFARSKLVPSTATAVARRCS